MTACPHRHAPFRIVFSQLVGMDNSRLSGGGHILHLDLTWVHVLYTQAAYGSGKDLAPPESQSLLLALIRQHWGVGSRALADIFVPSADAEDRRRFAAQQRDAADPEQAAAMLELSWQIDAKRDGSKVDVSTLVLHRQEDRAVPVDHGQWLARSIPGARLQLLPGDAHAPWFGPLDIAVQANSFLLG